MGSVAPASPHLENPAIIPPQPSRRMQGHDPSWTQWHKREPSTQVHEVTYTTGGLAASGGHSQDRGSQSACSPGPESWIPEAHHQQPPGCMPLAGDQRLAFWVLLPPVNTPHPPSSGIAECPHMLPGDPRTGPPEANHCHKTCSSEKQRCHMWPSVSPKQAHPEVSVCSRVEPTLPETPAAKATQAATKTADIDYNQINNMKTTPLYSCRIQTKAPYPTDTLRHIYRKKVFTTKTTL